jgi:hypothetical protein
LRQTVRQPRSAILVNDAQMGFALHPALDVMRDSSVPSIVRLPIGLSPSSAVIASPLRAVI